MMACVYVPLSCLGIIIVLVRLVDQKLRSKLWLAKQACVKYIGCVALVHLYDLAIPVDNKSLG